MNNNSSNTNKQSNNAPVFSSKQNSLSGNKTTSGEKLRFNYRVYDKDGKTVRGYFDAYRKLDVESFLTNQGYKIIEIKPTKISKTSS